MQLSIIIVNYNVKYFLEQCLFSVKKACLYIDAEVIVVDNLSSDGSKEYLNDKFPEVIFIWQSSNDGFGKASNSALKNAKGDYVLFLNPDTIVPEDCFEKCLAFFASNKKAGGLGVRMLDGTGQFLKESKRGFPTPVTSFFKMAGLAHLFPSSAMFARYHAGHLPENENAEVEVLAGAFMMLSKKAIASTAGFDEDFFMYGEDVDLSYRIKQAGMANFYLANTTILHFKGESTQKMSRDYSNHFYGAMLLFVKKHYGANKATVFFMQNAIAFSKLLASFKTKEKQTTNSASLNTAILASQPVFQNCIRLVQHASPGLLLAGRIALQPDGEKAIGTLDNTQQCIQQYKLDQLIFCEGEIGFKDIILKAESLKGKVNFLFHAAGSTSIVGSNDKSARGMFIAKP